MGKKEAVEKAKAELESTIKEIVRTPIIFSSLGLFRESYELDQFLKLHLAFRIILPRVKFVSIQSITDTS